MKFLVTCVCLVLLLARISAPLNIASAPRFITLNPKFCVYKGAVIRYLQGGGGGNWGGYQIFLDRKGGPPNFLGPIRGAMKYP